jgi:hypothetical protein
LKPGDLVVTRGGYLWNKPTYPVTLVGRTEHGELVLILDVIDDSDYIRVLDSRGVVGWIEYGALLKKVIIAYEARRPYSRDG